MDIKDIVTLCNAGFSKTEILALTSQTTVDSGENVTPSAPVSINSPARTAVVASPPEPADVPAAPPSSLDSILSEIRNLGNRLSSVAVNNSEMPSPMSADDVVAHILSAPVKGDNNGK